ncbi:Alb1-domain-containing protein [Lineolata rhizophorae]|uniref:Alb1-domain-containing protein n=1 Tax=Lineolata rhizophorae TaxID=578093 RepID=A0A6A6NLS3_9PEZI|nr:Alb1-domain-containing protein [Lineolata rhizophorae]
MAKTAKMKSKPPTKHSRAARRAASPSIDTDKSLKAIAPPKSKTTYVAPTPVRTGRVSKQKPKRRQQRERRQRGVERADVFADKLEKKVEDSVGRGKRAKARRAEWEELNKVLSGTDQGSKHVNAFALLEERRDGGTAAIDDEVMEAADANPSADLSVKESHTAVAVLRVKYDVPAAANMEQTGAMERNPYDQGEDEIL